MSMAEIKTALTSIGPMTAHDLQLHMGIGKAAARNNIRRLRDKGEVRITSYESQPAGVQGRRSPVYSLGSEDDALELPAKGQIERNRDYRKRHAAVISARRYPHVRQSAGVWAGLM